MPSIHPGRLTPRGSSLYKSELRQLGRAPRLIPPGGPPTIASMGDMEQAPKPVLAFFLSHSPMRTKPTTSLSSSHLINLICRHGPTPLYISRTLRHRHEKLTISGLSSGCWHRLSRLDLLTTRPSDDRRKDGTRPAQCHCHWRELRRRSMESPDLRLYFSRGEFADQSLLVRTRRNSSPPSFLLRIV